MSLGSAESSAIIKIFCSVHFHPNPFTRPSFLGSGNETSEYNIRMSRAQTPPSSQKENGSGVTSPHFGACRSIEALHRITNLSNNEFHSITLNCTIEVIVLTSALFQ